MRSFFNKIKNMDKRYRNALCALLLAFAVIVTGITLAYFTSRDEVTNSLEGHSYLLDIVLTEPNWSKTGSVDAKKIVPGMEIDKDPVVTNLMSENVYIRMRIEFEDGDGNTVKQADGETLTLFNYYGDTTEATTSEASTDTTASSESSATEATTQSVITDENSDWTYSRLLSTVYYNTTDAAKTHEHLVKLGEDINDNTVIAGSNNPYFLYKDGWFYYLDLENTSEADRTDLKRMAYKEQTIVPLFTDIKLPVFKDEYNDLFAQGFKIKVTVQAVNANQFKDDDGNEYIPNTSIPENMTDIENIFDKNFPDETTAGDAESETASVSE